MRNQILAVFILTAFLSCTNRNGLIERQMTYYDIVNTVLAEDKDLEKMLYEEDHGFDTITFRDLKLSIIPSGQFELFNDKSAFSIMSHGVCVLDTKPESFPDTTDFSKHEYSADSTLIPIWDSIKIYSDGFIDPDLKDSREAFQKALGSTEPYDIMILSLPFLNTTHDTSIINSTIITEDHLVERVFHLNLHEGEWNIYETYVVFFEVLKSREEMSSGQEKMSTSLVVKGRFNL